MSTDLYSQLCSYSNLELTYTKARKHKTLRPDVIAFAQDLKPNLLLLQTELLLHAYQPQPLTTFVIKDPKTRKISKSAFRDRVVHHALCNIIEPLFEKNFIYDSYANRKNKGTLKAIQRFQTFSRKVSHNHTALTVVLKADIRKYFETVNHNILISLLQRKIKDTKIIWLIQKILSNYSKNHVGMPLGNLTSQFFANIYLHELDHFVKQQLKAQYYIRYVDDFVILHHSKHQLQEWQSKIEKFLIKNLQLQLHPDKTKIILASRGIEFLGLCIFPKHTLLKHKNLRKFHRKFNNLYISYYSKNITYNSIYNYLEGWIAYAKHANTYNVRQHILAQFEQQFSTEISKKEIKYY